MKIKGMFLAILFFLIVIAVAVALTYNVIIRTVLVNGVKNISGLDIDVERVDVDIFKTTAGIYGLKIFNPAGFESKVMLIMPEIFVDYDIGSLFKKQVHLRDLKAAINEVDVVTSKTSGLNVNSLAILMLRNFNLIPQKHGIEKNTE